jgi:feruloyl esterase
VELGEAPTSLVATQTGNGQPDGNVVRTRPVFAYPRRAVYSGSGSIDDAANFRSEMPSTLPDDNFDWLGADLFNQPAEGR